VIPPAEYQYYEGSSGSRNGSNLEEFHLNLPYEEIKVTELRWDFMEAKDGRQNKEMVEGRARAGNKKREGSQMMMKTRIAQ
jgi:hypothetical protein